jgi:hypothetical protein
MTWLKVTFAMIAKLVITSSYGTIYVFTAEQFPTVIRNVGLGASSTFARIGGVIAPYINFLVWFEYYYKFLSSIIFEPSFYIVFVLLGFVLGTAAIRYFWILFTSWWYSFASSAGDFE